jgi:S-(hydroxymethyl)mycothiol dehydrogenase
LAEKTLVAAGQCTKVDPSARPAAVGLLGCGVMAGIGAAINTGAVTHGKSVAVIGCGGVGVAAVAGAALAGANPIIAVDIDAKKLAAATRLGATHTVDSSRVDPVEEIRRIAAETYPGAHGADVVIEAVGRPETWKQAFYARDLAGVLVLVGVPTPDMTVPDLPLIDVFGRGGALKSSWYGDCLPTRDFPMLVNLYQQGRLDLDAFVTEEIGIGDVEAAFEKMHHGNVLRSVVIL